MDLVGKSYLIHSSQVPQTLSPITSPPNSIFKSSLHTSGTSFPIIAIAIIGILATAFLLVSYYIFVIKCCLNWHRIDLLRRFSLSRNQQHEDLLMGYSTSGLETRGLDESVIRSIPVFQYKKKKDGNRGIGFGDKCFSECAVCLSEFQEDEKLRIIPNCCHVFHIDCIDVWLQNNANCPLCRTSISINTTTRFPLDQIIAPSSSPEDPNPFSGSLIGGDEDFVVIELGNGNNNSLDQNLFSGQERLNSVRSNISPSPKKLENRAVNKKGRKFPEVKSMGDECIDIREKDEQFSVQPIRRSFSMDSSNDRQLFLAIQQVVQNQRQGSEVNSIEGCSSRFRMSFFSFGIAGSRGSKSTAVLPICLEP